MELEDLDFEKIIERLKSVIIEDMSLYGFPRLNNISFYSDIDMQFSNQYINLSRRVVDILVDAGVLIIEGSRETYQLTLWTKYWLNA